MIITGYSQKRSRDHLKKEGGRIVEAQLTPMNTNRLHTLSAFYQEDYSKVLAKIIDKARSEIHLSIDSWRKQVKMPQEIIEMMITCPNNHTITLCDQILIDIEEDKMVANLNAFVFCHHNKHFSLEVYLSNCCIDYLPHHQGCYGGHAHFYLDKDWIVFTEVHKLSFKLLQQLLRYALLMDAYSPLDLPIKLGDRQYQWQTVGQSDRALLMPPYGNKQGMRATQGDYVRLSRDFKYG